MSDSRDSKSGLIFRLRRWARDNLVQDVSQDLANCEFGCRALECSKDQWETCEHRLRGKEGG